MPSMMSRRNFLQVTGGLSLTTFLASCGLGSNNSGSSGSGGSNLTIWDIRTGAEQKEVQGLADRFNKMYPSDHAKVQFFQNDPYKQKLQVAMGAHDAPDIFYGWGGGTLQSYINANDVYDLTANLNGDTAWKNKYIPSMLGSVTFNNKLYGIPNSNVLPVVFYYNKDIFAKYHLSVPQTWSEFQTIVATLKSNNVIPVALGGADQWTYLMYIEYLADRFGGPDALNAVMANEAGAWSNDAFTRANTVIQELVSAGTFGKNYAAISYGNGQSTPLLYTNKAAMQLMGAWDFAGILGSAPQFVAQDKLGWFPFPEVEGGKGDPKNVAGNPCNYYSIAQNSKAISADLNFLKNVVLDETQVDTIISLGGVPPVQGISDKLAAAPNSSWLQFIYNLTLNAPHYQLSWDQALAPTAAQALLTNLSQIFLKQITPQQFATNMNKTISAS